MTTTHISTIEAKEEFSELINRVSHGKEQIIFTRRGKEIAALIPLEDYQKLQTSQRKSDLEEAVSALQEARSQGTTTLAALRSEIGES